METVNQFERHTFVKYDNEHYLLYLNEQPVTFTMPGFIENGMEGTVIEPVQVKGYSYTGDFGDGSTIIEAKNVTDENRRDKFIEGLLKKRYPDGAPVSALSDGETDRDSKNSANEFMEYLNQCERDVDELLNREKV